MLVWGSEDELFPQNGFVVYAEEMLGTRTSFSLSQTRSYMLTRHGCEDFEVNQVQSETSAYNVIRIVYLRCHAPAVLYFVGGLGHEYPDEVELKLLDNQTDALMEDAIFDFLLAL